MTFADRIAAAKSKLLCYAEEVLALKSGGFGYAVGFAILLALLLPVLIVEVALLIAFGVDVGINQTRSPEIAEELRKEEVPVEFQHLIPLARKWGIGDAEERDALIRASSKAELADFLREVGPRLEDIAAWTDGYSEERLRDSPTAGYFIFLETAYEEVLTHVEEHEG